MDGVIAQDKVNPLGHLTRIECEAVYRDVMAENDQESMRRLALYDLFFLLSQVFNRPDIGREQWLFERCREVEAQPDGMLDLWAREHYKSTVITYGATIQSILRDPTITVGIFSCTRPMAKDFLKMIKTEFENNELLKGLFPEVLYENPHREAPSWSLDTGITVKRSTNSREATVEAWGLIEGQPIGKHFRLVVYDDVITDKHVSNPDMIAKVNESWELSLNLGARGGTVRYIGTRYHFNDTYRLIIEREAAVPRIHAATDDGTPDGNPVFLTPSELAFKRKTQGPYIFGCQQLMNPTADDNQSFHLDWIRYYSESKAKKITPGWNYYLLCDPAGGKKKENDYTSITVIGLAPDGCYYLVDGIRDRLNLTERTKAIFRMHRKYRPQATGYEKYGKDADIEHIEYVMGEENYHFEVIPLGGNTLTKEDRIKKLVPVFEQKRFFLPIRLMFTTVEGQAVDFVQSFLVDEYEPFPLAVHDDIFDNIARILDKALGAVFPMEDANQKRSGGAEAPRAHSEYDPYAA